MKLFSTELGARARAVLVALSGLATALILLLQAVQEQLSDLPDWGFVGNVLMVLTAIIVFLGRFTGFGNQTPPDPPEGDA
jgi:hypothetical protein